TASSAMPSKKTATATTAATGTRRWWIWRALKSPKTRLTAHGGGFASSMPAGWTKRQNRPVRNLDRGRDQPGQPRGDRGLRRHRQDLNDRANRAAPACPEENRAQRDLARHFHRESHRRVERPLAPDTRRKTHAGAGTGVAPARRARRLRPGAHFHDPRL